MLTQISTFSKFKRNKPSQVCTADDLFGRMVAAELKQISHERKRFVKQKTIARIVSTASKQHTFTNF